MIKKTTIKSVVQAATKAKSVSVNGIKKFADTNYPEVGINIKDINNYLYGEYYDNTLFGSCERFERII